MLTVLFDEAVFEFNNMNNMHTDYVDASVQIEAVILKYVMPSVHGIE